MVNPDGVVMGNTRCTVTGKDLNRQWLNPDKALVPEVHLVKEYIIKTQKKREIEVFTDLHGHS